MKPQSLPRPVRRPIVRVMGEIVGAVRDRLTGWYPGTDGLPDKTRPRPLTAANPDVRNLSYEYGTPEEIEAKVREMCGSAEQRKQMFPLIILVLPVVTEHRGPRDKARLRLGICMQTNNEWFSSQRQTEIFEPILIPIRDALFEEIARRQPYFFIQDPLTDMQHTEVHHFKWGEKAGVFSDIKNPFNGHIDCIEIVGLELTLN